MKFTPEQRELIREALASGEKSIQFRDRKIEFRSVEEMKEIIAMADSVPFSRRRHRAIFNKGV